MCIVRAIGALFSSSSTSIASPAAPRFLPPLASASSSSGAVSAGAVTSTFAETSTFPVMYSKRSLRSMSDTRSNFAFSAAAMYCGWASFGFSACARAKNQIASTVRYPFPIFAL